MSEQNLAQWSDQAVPRGQMYALLAVCLNEPTPELMTDLQNGALAAAMSEYLGALGVSAIEHLPALTDTGPNLQTYIVEYMRLFIGPGHLPCPPYESYYRTDVPVEERKLLMGSAAMDVLRIYRGAGLNLAEDYHDLPDHIATELEFMYYLSSQESEAWQAGHTEEARGWLVHARDFLRDHLSKWIPAFSQDLAASAELDFYRAIAKHLESWLAAETERL